MAVAQEIEMRILGDVPIPTDDGIELRADVFLPEQPGSYPSILSYGPYGKGLSFEEGYRPQWEYMIERYPEVSRGTSNRYQNWEVVDPERWVPDGYAVVRVDSRGAGRSPGFLDVWSAREAQDLYLCIEWAAEQEWSNGRIGLAGISYYAMNQYQVAALQPPHLAAICPWEGASDWYRDFARHGGILCEFAGDWYTRQVHTVQHGVGERGFTSSVTGELVAGPETLDPETLEERRADLKTEMQTRTVLDEWHLERNPDWSRIEVPMLSAANWGGQGLHLRGNIEAFTQSASTSKWLEVHGDAHWVDFYTDRGVVLQKRFFDHFLKGVDNGWDDEPPVLLGVRHIDGSLTERKESEWPIGRTEWTKLYLTGEEGLDRSPDSRAVSHGYDATGPGITFSTPPLESEMEITGPPAAKLFVSSDTIDADLFLVVRVFDTEDDEVTFMGALDPNTPIAQGWLRASHRALDEAKTLPHRPYHTHVDPQPLEPGQVYELDVEIWPTSIVIPAGYRLALTVRGNDYRYEGPLSDFARSFHYAGRGVGPFKHSDPGDRPDNVFGGAVTVHSGGATGSHLLVPIIPGPA